MNNTENSNNNISSTPSENIDKNNVTTNTTNDVGWNNKIDKELFDTFCHKKMNIESVTQDVRSFSSNSNKPEIKNDNLPLIIDTNKTAEKPIIFIDKITLFITLEITKEEKKSGTKLSKKSIDIPIDNSIELIIKFLLEDYNNYDLKFSKNTILKLDYKEDKVEEVLSKGKLKVLIEQNINESTYIIPNKDRIYEVILGDEINYHLINFYDLMKGSKETLENEIKFQEEKIIKDLIKTKKWLEEASKLSIHRISKNLFKIFKEKNIEQKKEIDKGEKEMKKRWKKRFDEGIYHINTGKEGVNVLKFNYIKSGFEIQLLADILEIDMKSLRRLIKRLEKKKKKTYLLDNNKGLKMIDETDKKIPKNDLEKNYGKTKGFIKFEGFFEVISYVKSL